MIDSSSIELVVTSPPYPMVAMWDEVFAGMDAQVATAIEQGDGNLAFERMHRILDAAWDELARVVVDGGIVCINIGDATRTVADEFRLYPNHARIISALHDRGFVSLPGILWHKPTNAATKFMGSGMLPSNAYPTLEHEHLLVFRRGKKTRPFPAGDSSRYASAFFWEERNSWFSDIWSDVIGTDQSLPTVEGRERSAAFPLEIPYRLINMFSIYGDTVLDPFSGTGTTQLAAMLAARNSVGVDSDPTLIASLEERLAGLSERSRERVEERLELHREFVEKHHQSGGEMGYRATHYDFPVMTAQEQDIRFYVVDDVAVNEDSIQADHLPFDEL